MPIGWSTIKRLRRLQHSELCKHIQFLFVVYLTCRLGSGRNAAGHVCINLSLHVWMSTASASTLHEFELLVDSCIHAAVWPANRKPFRMYAYGNLMGKIGVECCQWKFEWSLISFVNRLLHGSTTPYLNDAIVIGIRHVTWHRYAMHCLHKTLFSSTLSILSIDYFNEFFIDLPVV